MKIKIPDTFMGKPIQGSIEELLKGTPPESIPPSEIIVQSTTDFWTISGVHYRDSIYDVDLTKILLDGGSLKTQDQWIAFSIDAQTRNEPYTPSAPLFYSVCAAAYKAKDDPTKRQQTEEIKAFLKKHLFERWLMTTTRIHYASQRGLDDRIVHDINMTSQSIVTETFVYPDEWVKNSMRPSNYKALLGTDNPVEIQNVFHWITEKDAYLWRLNNRTSQVEERVVSLDANSDELWLYCNRDPANTDASLGVRAVKHLQKTGVTP